MNKTTAIPHDFISFARSETKFEVHDVCCRPPRLLSCFTMQDTVFIVQMKWEGHDLVWTFAFGQN